MYATTVWRSEDIYCDRIGIEEQRVLETPMTMTLSQTNLNSSTQYPTELSRLNEFLLPHLGRRTSLAHQLSLNIWAIAIGLR